MKEDIKTIALILGRNYRDAEITISDHKVYKKVKQAVEVYEKIMKEVGEQTLKEMDVDKFETSRYKIQKIKRATLMPVDGMNKGMVGVKEELVQDTKALNDYVKKNGKLPDGWIEVVSEYTKFTIK